MPCLCPTPWTLQRMLKVGSYSGQDLILIAVDGKNRGKCLFVLTTCSLTVILICISLIISDVPLIFSLAICRNACSILQLLFNQLVSYCCILGALVIFCILISYPLHDLQIFFPFCLFTLLILFFDAQILKFPLGSICLLFFLFFFFLLCLLCHWCYDPRTHCWVESFSFPSVLHFVSWSIMNPQRMFDE